ncbi:MAG: DUF4870 domain-containing protein [Aggregatilineales bacterium]
MTEQPKPKRDACAAQDEVDIVDLDALMRNYGHTEAPPRRAPRLEDDYDTLPKRKNEEATRKWREPLEDFLRTPYDKAYAPESVQASSKERLLAAVAHLSLLLGIPLGLASVGLLAVFVALLPLSIYLNYRGRLPFVAAHALQASLALLASTIGWIILTAVVGIIGLVITVLATITIIGVIIVPFVWLGLLLIWLALLGLPLVAFMLSLAAAVQALRGRTFRYPYIGKLAR